MPCGSCVETLARKLVEHHKIDLIRAYELAEKGVQRVEARNNVFKAVGDDYILNCVGSTVGHPDLCGTQGCYIKVTKCAALGACSGTCTCPEPSKAHSHQVRSGCICNECCKNYGSGACPDGCNCTCTGTCGYDCDVGYVWNPVTLVCELAAVGIVSKRLLVGVGL